MLRPGMPAKSPGRRGELTPAPMRGTKLSFAQCRAKYESILDPNMRQVATPTRLSLLPILMGIVGALPACGDAHPDAANAQSPAPATLKVLPMQLPRKVELLYFNQWEFGRAEYPDAASIDAEIQRECSRMRMHTRDAQFPDFKSIVIPSATVVIIWNGLTDRTGYNEYETLYAVIHSSDPRGFTLADFLLHTSRVVHASMRDADHHYLEGIQLHTSRRLEWREVPREFQGYPAYILHCGS